MKKLLYSLILIGLTAVGAQAQVAEDPAGPRKPVIDNISAGGVITGSLQIQVAVVDEPIDDIDNGTSTTAQGGDISAKAQASNEGNDATNVERDMRIYPVPASTTLTIDLGSEVTAQLSMVNVIGREVYQESTTSRTIRIDVSSFSPGTYFVTIKVGGDLITRKFQVAHS